MDDESATNDGFELDLDFGCDGCCGGGDCGEATEAYNVEKREGREEVNVFVESVIGNCPMLEMDTNEDIF